jgi:CheY-like chemotaxis protein
MHVLLVEDDEVLTPIVEAALRKAGHTCETTEQGAEAVVLAKQNHYDVMVVDADLPDMEGCQVVRLLKVEGIDIPVVLQSDVMDLNLPFVAASLGVKKFLTKPFSASELIGHMEAVAGTPGQAAPDAAPAPAPTPGPEPEVRVAPPQADLERGSTPMPATQNVERRRGPRTKVFQAALILDGDRQIPCVILDISERGGALRITDPDQPCPTLFTLKPLDGPERLCEVRWRRGDRIGIELR